MARRRRGRSRRHTPRWIATAGWIALIGVVVAAAVGGFVYVKLHEPEGTDERLCLAKSGPAGGLALLLDLTDSLNKVQHERLRGVIDRRISDAVSNTLIAVGAVRTVANARGADFASCKPVTGDQANELYENPRMIEERYQKRFRRPLDSIVSEMLRSPAATSSPIMESLQALLVDAPGFVDAKYPRHVIIVSDLLQHSPAFSFYRGDSWRRFVRSPAAERLAGRLKGVVVEICRVPRPNARVNKAEVENFWVNYFDRAGAHRVLTSTCPLGDL